jgi:hypothetical protein
MFIRNVLYFTYSRPITRVVEESPRQLNKEVFHTLTRGLIPVLWGNSMKAHRGLLALIATLGVLAVALFAGTPAASAKAEDVQVTRWTLTETQYTWDGRTISRKSFDVTNDPSAVTEASRSGTQTTNGESATVPGSTTSYSMTSGGSSSPYGCRGVSLKIERISLTHLSTLYRGYYNVKWCWYLGVVLGPYNGQVPAPTAQFNVTHLDRIWWFDGQVNGWNQWYTWAWNVYKSGYKTYRQWKFQSCLWLVCTQTTNPWAKVYVHADGTYSWDKSNG